MLQKDLTFLFFFWYLLYWKQKTIEKENIMDNTNTSGAYRFDHRDDYDRMRDERRRAFRENPDAFHVGNTTMNNPGVSPEFSLNPGVVQPEGFFSSFLKTYPHYLIAMGVFILMVVFAQNKPDYNSELVFCMMFLDLGFFFLLAIKSNARRLIIAEDKTRALQSCNMS